MVENRQRNAPKIEIVSKCANSFPNYFFAQKFGKFLFAINKDFFDKIFLFSFSGQNFDKIFRGENIGRYCFQWNKLKTTLKSNILEHLTYNQNVKLRKLRNLRIRTSQLVHFLGQRKVSMVRV
jgi:hypothetical protein